MKPINACKLSGFALGCVMFWMLASASDASAQDISLRDRLVFGLKARHPSEVTFLEQVAAQVDADVIPDDLVDGVFFFVREEKANSKFPFIYFERILRLQGARLSVPIPPYNGPFKQ